jgi:hypothetical protein
MSFSNLLGGLLMKRLVFFMAVTVLVCSSVLAQNGTGTVASAEAQNANQTVILDSGAQLSAELLTTLEAGKAKPGDEFKMRTVKPVISGGKQVIAKGAVLTGHVVESARAEGKEGVSRLQLNFDQLRNKNLTMPFSATIEQITQVSLNTQGQMDDMGGPMVTGGGAAASRTSGRTSGSGSSNGGLLGGVTGTVNNTLGGVTGATGGAVGGVVDTVGQTTGQVTGRVIATSSQTVNGAAAGAKGLIAITSTTSAEASGSSTLSLTGKNMKIDQGSVFSLRTDKSLNVNANESTQVNRTPNQKNQTRNQ